MWGLRPGPLLFESDPTFVWGLISSMYIGNLVCLVAGMAIIPFLMSFLRIPTKIMAPIIVIICIVGSYSVNNNMFDVWFMIFAGIGAFYLKRYAFPIPPVLLAFVLAPRFEISVRQALSISNGNAMVFLQKPIALGLLLFTFALLLAPVVMKIVAKIKKSYK